MTTNTEQKMVDDISKIAKNSGAETSGGGWPLDRHIRELAEQLHHLTQELCLGRLAQTKMTLEILDELRKSRDQTAANEQKILHRMEEKLDRLLKHQDGDSSEKVQKLYGAVSANIRRLTALTPTTVATRTSGGA